MHHVLLFFDLFGFSYEWLFLVLDLFALLAVWFVCHFHENWILDDLVGNLAVAGWNRKYVLLVDFAHWFSSIIVLVRLHENMFELFNLGIQ